MASSSDCRTETSALIQHITPCQSELSIIKVNILCSVEGCGKICATQSSLRMHLEKVHRLPSSSLGESSSYHWYHCPEKNCRYNIHADPKVAKHFTKMGSLKQHWLKVHAARVLICPDCKTSSFSCQRLLFAHRRSCGLPLHCAVCPSTTFTSLEALQSHCRRNQHSPAQHSLLHIQRRLLILAEHSKEKKLVQQSGNTAPSTGQPLKTFSMKLEALNKYTLQEQHTSDLGDKLDANLPAVSASIENNPCKYSFYKKTNDGAISLVMFDNKKANQTLLAASDDQGTRSVSCQEKNISYKDIRPLPESFPYSSDFNDASKKSFSVSEITTDRNNLSPSNNLNIQSKISSNYQKGLPMCDKRKEHYLHNCNIDSNIISEKSNSNLSLCNTDRESCAVCSSATNSCCRAVSGKCWRRHKLNPPTVASQSFQCLNHRCCDANTFNCLNCSESSIPRCYCKCSRGTDDRNDFDVHSKRRGLPNKVSSKSCTVNCSRNTNSTSYRVLCNEVSSKTCISSHCYNACNDVATSMCCCQPLLAPNSLHLSSQDQDVSHRMPSASHQSSSPAPPVRPPPHHLLAAIALSELAAPALKSNTRDESTQTRKDLPVQSSFCQKCGCGPRELNSTFECSSTGAYDVTEHESSFETNHSDVCVDSPVRMMCGRRVRGGVKSKGDTSSDISPTKCCRKTFSRLTRKRKSAETQTRLTRKESIVRRGFDDGLNSKQGRCYLKRSNSTAGSSSKRRHMNALSYDESQPKIECVDASINTEDESSDLNRESLCVLDAFPSESGTKHTDELAHMVDINASKDESYCEYKSAIDQHTADNNTNASNGETKSGSQKYVIVENIDSIAVETSSLPLSVELSSVNVGPLHSSSGTQTSPRAMVSVGIVTCGALYQDLSLALLAETGSVVGDGGGVPTDTTGASLLSIQTSYDVGSGHDKQACDSNSRLPLLVSGDLCANSASNDKPQSTVASGSVESDFDTPNESRYGKTSEQDPASGIECGTIASEQDSASGIECGTINHVRENSASFPTATTGYSNDTMLLEDEENYVLMDRNLSEMSTCLDLNCSSENMKAAACPTRFIRPPKLSEIRSSSIETQTEHDILLSVTRACLSDVLDAEHPSSSASQSDWDASSVNLHSVVPKVSAWCTDSDNQDRFPAPPSESAWCTIETQTCEDFSDIEQFMCSSTHTQTSEQVRRELFPELSFADTQTQTGLDDLTCLVHSHTQTNF